MWISSKVWEICIYSCLAVCRKYGYLLEFKTVRNSALVPSQSGTAMLCQMGVVAPWHLIIVFSCTTEPRSGWHIVPSPWMWHRSASTLFLFLSWHLGTIISIIFPCYFFHHIHNFFSVMPISLANDLFHFFHYLNNPTKQHWENTINRFNVRNI